MSVAEDTVARNRALQTEWYGEPLGDRVRPLLGRLGLSQSGLAGVLGLSAPMLSQLMSGQRAKISNPAVLHRLMAVEDMVAAPAFGALAPAEIKERLAEIKADPAATTSGIRMAASERAPVARPAHTGEQQAGRGPADPARLIQVLLREVASAAEIEAAAGLIADRYPELAEVLRVYGTGRTSEAEAHFVRTVLKETLSETVRDRTVMP
ncbi:helix-turn-helix domain-containing protein [Actinomadura darangshiensis]|uniref:helix-turn-helix domain-containing protein n=1 Tax=Actinomadura darangshiensis TaxID=705336 RepID=UPI001A9FB289|nr:helix-turn-helix domain-containing protein [Actinomadura darangshiensis]